MQPADNMEIMVPLLTSKNPSEVIRNMALDKVNCTFPPLMAKCNPGFVLDESSGLCYIALNGTRNFWIASETCIKDYKAELVAFGNNNQVQAFQRLLNNGNKPYLCNFMHNW